MPSGTDLMGTRTAAPDSEYGDANGESHEHAEHHHDHEGDFSDDHGDTHEHADHHHGHDHDPTQVMTTVKLTFAPTDEGDAVEATWADPEADGDPRIDTIALKQGVTYELSIVILNELESPVEDVTPELRDELDEHQFFFTGEKVASPSSTSTSPIITPAYADEVKDGYPVGLINTVEAVAAGEGTLTIMLRTMPPINGTPIKTGMLAELVKNGQVGELPGRVDINVEFPIIVE